MYVNVKKKKSEIFGIVAQLLIGDSNPIKFMKRQIDWVSIIIYVMKNVLAVLQQRYEQHRCLQS